MSLLEYAQIDQEVLVDVAAQLHRIKMFPYFDIAHYVLMIISVRDELAGAAGVFSRKHPLSCWLSSMLMCFAGNIVANLLLGEPVIAPFKRHNDVLLATAVWYLIFYAPFDLAYKLAHITPIRLVLYCMKEVLRAYKVSHGVSHATKLYPNAYLVHVIVGTAKGAGSGLVKIVEQLVRGVWLPNQHELLRPTFATKACVLASIALTAARHAPQLAHIPHDLVYLAVVGFFVYFKLSAALLGVTDPLAPFENLFCAVFMGGIWDALQRAVAAARERRSDASKENGALQNDVKKEQ